MSQLENYTPEGQKALIFAREEAVSLRHRLIDPEHLALGILKVKDPTIESLFAQLHVDAEKVVEALTFVVGRGNKAIISRPTMSQATRTAVQRAGDFAATLNNTRIGIEHLLLGLLDDEDGVAVGILENFGLTRQRVEQEIRAHLGNEDDQSALKTYFYRRMGETPTLNLVSRDLTMLALMGKLDPLVGREAELERTMQILSRCTKNNPALIGPAGVGKTAIAEGLAVRIVEGRVPENLHNCRVVSLDVGLLTVGTRFRGDFEERLKLIMQEILKSREIIIVIDELHALVGTGVAEGSIDAGNLFKPMLARGEFRCIGAATLDDYRKTIEADPALSRRFQPVMVNETTREQTLEVLRGLRSHYADYHQVEISDDALVAAVRMSARFVLDRFQPDKALDLLDEAAARVRVSCATASSDVQSLRDDLLKLEREKDEAIERGDFTHAASRRLVERRLRKALVEAEDTWQAQREIARPVVDRKAIAAVVAMWTGIPVEQIAGEEAERLLHLEESLHSRVIGQHEGVQVVARAMRRARTDMRDGQRPIGSFLFVGPTGVGKTELARALAGTLFGDECALLKLDMSEFMEQHAVSRLLGSPPGYVGYDAGGQLIEAVRRRPYSIVLFDEIEKAHPAIFDLLLQILNDGCLTDAQGHTVSFRHTIVILTSNVGTSQIKQREMSFVPASKIRQEQRGQRGRREQQGQQEDTLARLRSQILPIVADTFRPELLNRFDEIVVFHPLEHGHLREIVDLMVAQTQQRIIEQSIDLRVSDTARDLLVEQGYDPTYGARPLRRAVQRLLDDMLAESLLRGEIKAGDVVRVDAVEEKLAIQVENGDGREQLAA
jgi:ATP-dependent Clp protease ATP-binding subunit ClpC